MSLIVGSLISVTCLWLSWHCWAYCNHLVLAKRIFRDFRNRCWKNSSTSRSADVVCRQMDELRVQHTMIAAGVGVWITASIMIVYCVLYATAPPYMFLRMWSVLAVFYILCFVITQKVWILQPAHIPMVSAAIMTLLIVRSFWFTGSMLFVLSGLRTIVRIVFGLLVLDFQTSFKWNMLLSIVLLWQCQYHSISAFDAGVQLSTFALGLFVESITFGGIMGILFLVETMITHRLQVAADMRVSRNAQNAVRKLLAVLCDAEVNLGPDLGILEPSQKLCHLLQNCGVEGWPHIDGKEFTLFVQESERVRFREFINMAYQQTQADLQSDWLEACDGQDSLRPATSVHVTLSDGRKVELFHTHLPDVNNRPGHLIGIRECGSAHQEVVTSAEPDHVSACSGTEVAREIAKKGIPMTEREPSESSSTSSTSSSSMSTSRCRRTEIPELIEIGIDVDVGDDNLKVQKLVLRFDIAQALADPSLQPPRLVDWVPCDMWCNFREWLQDQLNAQFNQDSHIPRTLSHPFALYLPARCANAREEMLLEVADMSIELVEDDGGIDDENSEELPPLIARLRMRQFLQLNQVTVSRRPKFRHLPRKKSLGKPKSQTSELPAIEEVGDQ